MKNFFDRPDETIPPFKRNQFGGTFSGPVWIPKIYNGKNKLFFMFNYEGLREQMALTQNGTLPPANYRTGDFSFLTTPIRDPLTGTTLDSRTPFPGNRIPMDRISPTSARVLDEFYPLPNRAGTGASGLANELPFGRGKAIGIENAAANFLPGGWQLGGTLTLQDGFPLTAYCNGSATVQNGGGYCKADAVFGQNPDLGDGNRTPNHFFNTGTYVARTSGTNPLRYGISGRNTIIGPGIISLDFSANKFFRFGERQAIEFEANFSICRTILFTDHPVPPSAIPPTE